MLTYRSADSRGHCWLDKIDSHRTFTFPDYFDPRYRNYSDLQTINDDRVQPGWHVPEHEHKNMEIFGYVVEGVCKHTDNHGQVLDIPAGAVQRMSAGTGFKHTEGNASNQPNRYLQLWIRPNVQDVEPRHSWCQFTREEKLNTFCDITARLPIYADARLLAGIFAQDYVFELDNNRRYYMYTVTGTGQVSGFGYQEGDGFAIEQESAIRINPSSESEIILFDLR